MRWGQRGANNEFGQTNRSGIATINNCQTSSSSEVCFSPASLFSILLLSSEHSKFSSFLFVLLLKNDHTPTPIKTRFPVGNGLQSVRMFKPRPPLQKKYL